MYSDDDLNSAVTAGALSADAAANFRSHISQMRELPRGAEEDFRLISNFNDIFVAIGIVILLVAVGAIGQALAGLIAPEPIWPDLGTASFPTGSAAEVAAFDRYGAEAARNRAAAAMLAGLFVAATAWPLAEFFTRKRRMALPSILLLLAFVGGTFAAVLGGGMLVLTATTNDTLGALLVSGSALIAAAAAYFHWRRFVVPITVAAGSAAVGATIIALIASVIGPDNLEEEHILTLIFAAGLGVFAFAMRWDISDRDRTTRRSDVAFWLHLLAAPMIAHPVFALLGVTDGDNPGVGAAVGVLAVYIGFGLVALATDRRALLVSALIYVLFALTFLLREFGAVELNFALTALVIGSALLSLSAFWQTIRRAVVAVLPARVQAVLPATQVAALLPEASPSPSLA